MGFDSVEWKCPACDWEPVFLDRFPAFAPELAASNNDYDSSFFERLAAVEDGFFWFEARNALLTWALRKYFAGAKSLLEVGCGTGFVLREVGRKFPGMRLAGGEVFENGLLCAASRVPAAELMQLDATRMPFREEFDVIGAFDVIEHIEDDEAVLRELHATARRGGGVILTVPQHAFLWSNADDYAHHKRRYERRDLLRKVERAGFEVAMATSFVSLLMPVLLAARRGRGRNKDYSVFREFEISTLANRAMRSVLGLERAGIRAGLRFAIGGSLLVVGKK
jgi:SAM-dependent methyltransferase